MIRSATVLALGLVVTVVGCKETKYKDSQATLDRLGELTAELKEKDKLITQVSNELGKLKQNCGEIVITITGDTWSVTGKGPSGRARPKDPTGTAQDKQLYDAFLKKVRGSRGSMRKCFNGALKKDSSLALRTISLKITVKYRSSGKVASMSLSKNISSAFKGCMKGVTSKWTLPATPKPFTFKAPVTLIAQ